MSPDPTYTPQTVPGLVRLRQRLYLILEAGKTGDKASSLFDGFMVVLILANVLAFAIETEPEIAARYGHAFQLFNLVSIAIFTLEYLIRLWVCVDHPPLGGYKPWTVRLKWAVTPSMLIDLVVILPFYLSVLFVVDLRVLRVVRLLRFLKLARFSPALHSIGRVLAIEKRAILGAVIVMFGLLVFSSTGIYWIEGEVQPEVFGSVPRAMWWALATLTTVGYGDVVPVTALGRLFGGLVMVFGLGMFALPIAIVSSGFAQEIHRRDFVVSWGMVARVPLFQGVKPAVLADLVELLEAQVVEAKTVLAYKGDMADAMYFIVVGRVQLDFGGRLIELSEGDFFGEMALLEDRRRSGTIVSLTRVHLLKLGATQFRQILAHHPEAEARIAEAARQRGLANSGTDNLEQEIAVEQKEKAETE
ncbi:MAG: cyclic nucleotide-gated ion channel [Parvibaculum sp.]